MTEQPHVERAARLLRQARSRITPDRSVPAGGAIAELGDTIRQAARRRRQRRALVGGALAAGGCAVAAAVLLVLRPGPQPAAPVAHQPVAAPAFVAARAAGATLDRGDGRPEALAAGTIWRPGDRVRSQGAPVELSGPDGTSLTLAASSELQLVRADGERWLRLTAGAVAVHVAKLGPGQRFVLTTPDAEVEVRGTRFRVELVPAAAGCGQGTVTRVQVTEGVVEVRGPAGDVRVPAGAHWPAGCPEVGAVAAHPRPRARVAPAPRLEVPSSTLATENDLFSSALRAEHSGDRREAIELLDVLLTRFPHSPLQASAAAARERLHRALPPGP